MRPYARGGKERHLKNAEMTNICGRFRTAKQKYYTAFVFGKLIFAINIKKIENNNISRLPNKFSDYARNLCYIN